MEPSFLGIEEVLAIHRDQVERYGGSLGLRDIGGLQSAIGMPSAGVGETYFHDDLFAMAAAYLYHIVQNHPFVDGNKRVGAVAAVVFLALNGVPLDADEDAFESLVLSVASGQSDKSAIARFLRENVG